MPVYMSSPNPPLSPPPLPPTLTRPPLPHEANNWGVRGGEGGEGRAGMSSPYEETQDPKTGNQDGLCLLGRDCQVGSRAQDGGVVGGGGGSGMLSRRTSSLGDSATSSSGPPGVWQLLLGRDNDSVLEEEERPWTISVRGEMLSWAPAALR